MRPHKAGAACSPAAPVAMSTAVLAFNVVFRDLVTTVKNETGSKDIKNAVKAAYRVWNAAASELFDEFHATFGEHYPAVLEKGFSAVPGDAVLLAGTTIASVVESIKDPEFVERAKTCVCALVALCAAAHVSDDVASSASVVDLVQKHLGGVESDLESIIMDEDLVKFVRQTASALATGEPIKGLPVTGGAPGIHGLPPGVDESGAIMSIARDISDGIDPEILNSPEGMQSLVQTVSAGIGQRISSGDIDPAALMKEATAMLAGVDISEMLKMFGGPGAMSGLGGIDLAGIAASMGQAPPTPKKR